MSRLRVGVFAGGRSAEHEVSVASAEAVLRAIDRDRFEPYLVYIDREGRWMLPEGPAPALAEIAKAVAVSQNDVERGLVMLERYQILKRGESAGGVGYAVAAPRYLNWHPRLDFIFHRMAISSGGATILTSVN